LSDGVRKQVTGKCTGLEVSESGWSKFLIDIGTQYPIKLETKLPKLVDEARAMIGGPETVWTFDESDGAPNPNRPGTNYKNRRLHAIGGQIDPALAQQSQGAAPGQTPPSASGARDESIERQVIVKAVLPLLGTEQIPDVKTAMDVIYQLDKFMGQPRVKAQEAEKPANEVPKPTAAVAPAGGYENDDDIPF
jgi:hypothetical protein